VVLRVLSFGLQPRGNRHGNIGHSQMRPVPGADTEGGAATADHGEVGSHKEDNMDGHWDYC